MVAADPVGRTCAECGETKSLDEFGKKQGRGTLAGRRLVCKDCGKRHRVAGIQRQRAARAADPEAPAVVPNKVCTRCDNDKPLAEFGPYDGTLDQHDFLCADCRALATAEREARAQKRVGWPRGKARKPAPAAPAA